MTMDSDLESLEVVRNTLKNLFEGELLPLVDSGEKSGEFAHSVHKKLGQLGLAGPILPQEYGGADNPYFQFLLAEEAGYFSSGFGLSSLASTCLFGANVANGGSEEQKQKYLPPIISGEKLGCWALTEPQAGSHALGIQSTAFFDGKHYILNGSKTFITNAPIADYFFILCRDVGGKPPGQGAMEGGSAFIVERGQEGLTVGPPLHKMGHLSSPTGEIFMEQVHLPPGQRVGAQGKAFFNMKHSLDVERIIFSGLGLGLMRFCLDRTLKYTKEREQFGAPISQFQMIQDHLAKMMGTYESCRAYLWKTLHQLARGEDIHFQGAICKLMIGEGSSLVTNLAIQCHGGYGYMKEYEVERCLRDAKLFEIGAGTNEVQKLIIAKQALKMETIHPLRGVFPGESSLGSFYDVDNI